VANRLHGAARADLLNDAVASFDVAAGGALPSAWRSSSSGR
jgi:hypothetical protein